MLSCAPPPLDELLIRAQNWSKAPYHSCLLSMIERELPYDRFPLYTQTNTGHLADVGSMWAHRLQRRPNIDPILGQRVVFAGH